MSDEAMAKFQTLAEEIEGMMPGTSIFGAHVGSGLSRFLQEELEWQETVELLTEAGWHRVEQGQVGLFSEVEEWVNDTRTGPAQGRYTTWLFERAEDAVLFRLRWA